MIGYSIYMGKRTWNVLIEIMKIPGVKMRITPHKLGRCWGGNGWTFWGNGFVAFCQNCHKNIVPKFIRKCFHTMISRSGPRSLRVDNWWFGICYIIFLSKLQQHLTKFILHQTIHRSVDFDTISIGIGNITRSKWSLEWGSIAASQKNTH